MLSSKIVSGLLVLFGLIAAYVGVEILFFPDIFYAESGIVIGENINLRNELRASGGSLLISSVFIVLGAFFMRLRLTAIFLSTLIYLSYGVSRLYSMAIDGMPADTLANVAAIEITIGLICAFMLAVTHRESRRQTHIH